MSTEPSPPGQTTPGQIIAELRERFTPLADALNDEIERQMRTVELESDGSFEFPLPTSAPTINATVLRILNGRYNRPDETGWLVFFHEPNLLELVPQAKAARDTPLPTKK